MKTFRLAAILIIVSIVVFVMIQAKHLLLPLVVAIGIWYLINTIAVLLRKIKGFPSQIALITSSLLILLCLFGSIEIIIKSVESMVAHAPRYHDKFHDVLASFLDMAGMEKLPSFAQVLHDVDLKPMVAGLGATFSDLAGQLLFVVIYTIFMLMEQGTFSKKLLALSKDAKQHNYLKNTFNHINASIRTYISIKTGICMGSSVAAFLIMTIFGLDFAIFWAFLIFLLNYIPTFGSMIGTVLPAAFAMLQFDSIPQVVLLGLLIWGVQFLLANFIEPKLMGNSLNISTLVVLVSLALWGEIWGIAGMIFSVPIMVIIILVCAEFPSTRPLAILLSQEGKVQSTQEKEAEDRIAAESVA